MYEYKNKNVKGVDIIEYGPFAILSNDEVFKLKVGENNMKDCDSAYHNSGIYFSPLSTIFKFANYHDGIHVVTFEDDEDIFVECVYADNIRCKAKKLFVQPKQTFEEFFTIPETNQVDVDKCVIALSKCGESLKWMPKSVQNDPGCVSLACSQDGNAIRFASDAIRNNLDVCKVAAAQDGCSIRYMSDEMKNNIEVCCIAANQSWNSVRFMSPAMRCTSEVCKVAAYRGFPKQYIDQAMLNDPEVQVALQCRTKDNFR